MLSTCSLSDKSQGTLIDLEQFLLHKGAVHVYILIHSTVFVNYLNLPGFSLRRGPSQPSFVALQGSEHPDPLGDGWLSVLDGVQHLLQKAFHDSQVASVHFFPEERLLVGNLNTDVKTGNVLLPSSLSLSYW